MFCNDNALFGGIYSDCKSRALVILFKSSSFEVKKLFWFISRLASVTTFSGNRQSTVNYPLTTYLGGLALMRYRIESLK